jgi:hypothetical protein
LRIEKIAENKFEFEVLKNESDFIQDWEMDNLVELAKSKLGELKGGEKYCLKIPAVIGAEYAQENLGKITFSELIRMSGYLTNQIKDLEVGQKVELEYVD